MFFGVDRALVDIIGTLVPSGPRRGSAMLIRALGVGTRTDLSESHRL